MQISYQLQNSLLIKNITDFKDCLIFIIHSKQLICFINKQLLLDTVTRMQNNEGVHL